MYPYHQQDRRPYNGSGESSVYGMSYMDDTMNQQLNAQSYVQRWVEGQSQETTNMLSGPPLDEQWPQSESSMSSPVIPSNGRPMDGDVAVAGTYYPPYQHPHHHQHQQSLPHSQGPQPSQWPVSSNYGMPHGDPQRGQSPGYTSTPYAPSASIAASSQEHSPAGAPAPKLHATNYPYCPTTGSGSAPRRMDEEEEAPYPTAGRSSADSNGYSGGGNGGTAGLRCASCGATHSPEWRKGPSGKKDLCNA